MNKREIDGLRVIRTLCEDIGEGNLRLVSLEQHVEDDELGSNRVLVVRTFMRREKSKPEGEGD